MRFVLLMLVSFPAFAESPIFVDIIPIPEPGTLALLSAAAGVFLLRRIKR